MMDVLAPEILASWQRSETHGLRRQDRALFNYPLNRAIEKRVVEENLTLLTHASPEMVRLYTGLGSARWVALCVNGAGQVVCSVGDNTSAPRQIRSLMHPGRLLLESELGTTAPGCSLATGRPVVVARSEHYLHELDSFYCACAPIHGTDGELVGALDITGVDVRSLPLANDTVAFAARVIENSMLTTMQGCSMLRFHCDERLIGTPFEAILAFSSDGVIAGANRAARQLLELPKGSATQKGVNSLFEGQFGDVLSASRRRPESVNRVRLLGGTLAHVRVDAPQSMNRVRPVVRSVPDRMGSATKRLFVLKDEALVSGFDRALAMFRHGLPTLLEGETGTGKEVFARALHEATRPEGPFVALNCAAIPEGLIEAELFGYADGAFTGGRKGGAPGKIEQANAGVLFLDEIGDMPLLMQSRLLRVLQERVITRIGETREVNVDMLVLSATNRELELLVDRGTFRQDLLYRLNGFTLRLPPLRDRQDIEDIARELFLRFDPHVAASQGPRNLDEIIAADAFALFISYRWPGNVRQMEQTIRGLVALRSPQMPVQIHDLPDSIASQSRHNAGPGVSRTAESDRLSAAQESHMRRVLRDHDGNISAAARTLGVSRTTLYSRLKT